MAAPAKTGPAEYPKEFERDVTLKNGMRVHVRAIRPDDAPRLSELYDRLSRHTLYQRFFTVMKRLPPDWARMFASVDYRTRFAVVAEHAGEHGPELVGVGRYEPTDDPETAEVAFVVQDGWQDRGLGTILFNDILRAASERGPRLRPRRQPPDARPHHPLRRHQGAEDRAGCDRAPLHAARMLGARRKNHGSSAGFARATGPPVRPPRVTGEGCRGERRRSPDVH